VMNKGFVTLERRVGREAAQHALEGNPEWILVKEEGAYKALLLAVALAHALTEDKDAAEFDLYAIPGERLQVASIDLQANLQEALDRLNASSVEALYVSRLVAPGIAHVYGVLTRERIERSYRYS
jgi:CIC family chloride channel protein